MRIDPNLNIVIPTYRRPETLLLLLQDLKKQTVLPNNVYIVDGAPNTGQVFSILRSNDFPWQTFYIPSNHANAPFQRYIGQKAISNGTLVIYFDDDIRINQVDFIDKLINPFSWKEVHIVGISPQIVFPKSEIIPKNEKKIPVFLQQILNLGINTPPGEITPIGDRILPQQLDQPYLENRWLRGGVMAYRVEVLQKIENLFDVFAMSYIRCGLGVDDTYLSRCAMKYGKLLLALCATAEHPSMVESQITSSNGYWNGFARSYSRRFINDHYFPDHSPTIRGRLFLIKSYIGNIFLGLIKLINQPSTFHLYYLLGFAAGALKGLLVAPTASKLTPHIDWKKDAEEALAGQVIVNHV